MSSFVDKIRSWGGDETVRGLTPWTLLILALVLFNQRYDYVRTSLTETVEGFETQTIYLRQIGSKVCVGDMVQYRSVNRRSKYFKKVMAGAGAVLTVTDSGFRIDAAAHPMAAEWVLKAQEEMGTRTELSVPEGHVLFVNPEFKTGRDSTNWAFETVPRKNIKDWASHILFSRDISRIGEKVGTADPDCIR